MKAKLILGSLLTMGMLSMSVGSWADDLEKNSVEASVVRGSIAFQTYCSLCHGIKADGTGRAAKMYSPRPANLTLSQAPDEYKEMIIRKGGAAMGRSQFMPPWGDELTDEQIRDIVAYLHTIKVNR